MSPVKQTQINDIMASSGVKFGTSGARGLVTAMTDHVCYAYTAAFLQAVASEATQVVIGHDLRPSSPAITAACVAAIRDAGKQPVYVGALPTPAIALYAMHLCLPALVITGSHIPFDRNGIKFYRAEGEITKNDEHAIQGATVPLPEHIQTAALPDLDPRAHQHYLQRYVSFAGASALAGMRIAIYEHSSVARDILPEILQALGAQVLSLGRADVFVPIDTEAVRQEDILRARAWAQEYQFDAIISTDGDADRPLIGDEQGNWMRGDIVGILCAQYLKANIVVTPVSSNTAVEQSGLFDTVVRTRIGSPYVIAGMENHAGDNIVAGYEANGGFLLGTNIRSGSYSLDALPTRDAALPVIALPCLSKKMGCPMSQLASTLPSRYTASDRLQDFATEDSRTLLINLMQDQEQAAHILAPASGDIIHIDTTDGLRATFSNGDIVHLRPSGNAPELRCYAESGTPVLADSLVSACLGTLSRQAN